MIVGQFRQVKLNRPDMVCSPNFLHSTVAVPTAHLVLLSKHNTVEKR